MSLPDVLWISVQIILALIVLMIVYLITLSIMNVDAIVNSDKGNVIKEKEITSIVDGYAGPSVLKNMSFNTVNPYVQDYARINKSVNKMGGASFTYQYWMKVEDASDELFKDRIIMLKGDPRKYNLAYYNPPTNATNQYKLKSIMSPNYYVCCPMISFGNSYRELKVTFNTNNDMLTQIYIRMDPDGDPTSKKNLLSMMPTRWLMFTFVFEDNYSYTDSSENGIKFTLYVNDIPYWNESASRSPALRYNYLKQNDGDICFVPDIGTAAADFFTIGNVKYYNYAASQSEIASAFNAGPPNYPAVVTSNNRKTPFGDVGAYNKLDIYNF